MSLQLLLNQPETRAVLDARARELARSTTVADNKPGAEIVVFQLGEGRYSLPASAVQSVQPLSTYTVLPAAPSWLLGLVNVRGRLLCVLDLRPLLDLPIQPPQPDASLLVVSAAGVDFGVVADAVQGVQQIKGGLTPSFATVAGRGLPWVTGIDQQLTLVLDPSALLADTRLNPNGDRNQ